MQVGPYEILGELGRGGMGVVYRARRPQLDREVALKLLSPSSGSGTGADGMPLTRSDDTGAGSGVSSRRWIERFRREAQAAGRLGTHPGIVGVLDVGEDQGRLYLAMELIHGEGLDRRLQQRALEVDEALRITAEVARAVHYAHEQGIVHRDLKPGNILIDRDARAWVTDFGLAATTQLDAESEKITRTRDVVGTPAYLAPEQLRGEPVDGRTDVHALGCTLYELLCGATPFESEWLPVTCRRVLMDTPAPPSRSRPDLPGGLDAVVLRCLAKDPAERYPTAAALAEDCERLLAGEAPRTRAPGPAARAAAWLRKRRAPVAAACVVALAGAGGVAAIVWSRATRDAAEAERAATGRETAAFDRSRATVETFGRLAQQTQRPLRVLQDAFHGVARSPADVTAARTEVERAAAAVARDAPGGAAAAAWAALAGLYAGAGADPWRAFDAAQRLDPSDPFPAMVAALGRVEEYLRALELPRTQQTAFGLADSPFVPQTGDDRLRQAAQQALEAVPAIEAGAFTPELRALHELLEGARWVVERRFGEAAPVLRAAVDEPFFGALAAHLLGLAELAREDYEGAAAVWAGLVESRGWRDARRGQIRALTHGAQEQRRAGADPSVVLQRAEALAATLFEGSVSFRDHETRGRLRTERALWIFLTDGDERAALDGAIADLQAAHDGGSIGASILLSFALTVRADADDRHGGDPLPWLTRAEAVLEGLDPRAPFREVALLEQRFRVQLELARLVRGRNIPPDRAFEPAIRLAHALVEAKPDDAGTYLWLAQVYGDQSDALVRWNSDPSAAQAAAVRAYREALQRDPESPSARIGLGGLLSSAGKRAAESGRPFEPVFEEAKALLDRTAGSERLRPLVDAKRALLYHYWAEARWNTGGEVQECVRAAREAIAVALAADPRSIKWRLRAAEIELFVARARHGQRQPADRQIAAARAHVDAALKTRSRQTAAIALTAGRLYRLLGDDAALQGQDPMAPWGEAIRFYDFIVQARPRWGEPLLQRATCRLRMAAHARLALRRSGLPLLDAAIADLDAYLGLNPGDAAVWANRGAAYASKGDAVEQTGGDPAPWWDRAIADLAEAARLNPGLWHVHANRGMLLEGLKRDAEALAAFEAALAANPKAPGVAAMAAAVRKRLGK